MFTAAMVGIAQFSPPKNGIRFSPIGDELVDEADLVVQQPQPGQGGDDVGDQER